MRTRATPRSTALRIRCVARVWTAGDGGWLVLAELCASGVCPGGVPVVCVSMGKPRSAECNGFIKSPVMTSPLARLVKREQEVPAPSACASRL